MVNKHAGIALGCVLAVIAECNRADSYLHSGTSKYARSDYDGAIGDLDEAIRLNPNHISAYFNRAGAKAGKEDYDGAIRDYDMVLQLDPTYDVYYSRGLAKYSKGDFDDAIRDFDEAIRRGSDMLWHYYEVRAWAKRGNQDCDGNSRLQGSKSLERR